MYLKFFGLSERPFSITPDMSFFFMGKQQERAMDTLLYGVNERQGIVMLTGEVGTGKTMLTRALLARLPDTVDTALVVNPILSVPELLQAVIKDFGLTVKGQSPQKLIDALNKFLLARADAGRNAVVVIDEAQNLSVEALEALRMLTNLETDKHKLLQIMLVGQPELLKKVKSHQLRQLRQRITARCHLVPMNLTEMTRYVSHRLYTAGGQGRVFFDRKAYQMVHKQSQGVPRVVNLICDRALMAAFVMESMVIDRRVIKAALADWEGEGRRSPLGFLRRLVFSS